MPMIARRIRSRRSLGVEGRSARRRVARVAVRRTSAVEQRVEGGGAVAVVEGRPGLGGDAGLGQLHAGGDPGGGEVVGEALDRFQRLGLGPAREARLGQRDGDVGAARLQFGGLAQRELVARRQQLVGARGRQAVEEGFDLGGRHGADEFVDDLAVAEGLHRRDPLDRRSGRPAPGWSRCRPWPAPPRPRAWLSAASSAGLSCLQGPHQSAQKSTTTGTSLERSMTSRSKSASVASIGIAKS